MGKNLLHHPKFLLALTSLVLATIVFFQNRETIETRVLFFTIKTSRAATLGLAFLLGFAAGGTLLGVLRTRK